MVTFIVKIDIPQTIHKRRQSHSHCTNEKLKNKVLRRNHPQCCDLMFEWQDSSNYGFHSNHDIQNICRKQLRSHCHLDLTGSGQLATLVLIQSLHFNSF